MTTKTPTELNRVTAENGREEAEDLREEADHEHGGAEEHRAMAESARRSSREFAADPLALPLLGGVLWAAFGVNRLDGGRTAPPAIDAQEIDVFAAATGAFLYDAAKNGVAASESKPRLS